MSQELHTCSNCETQFDSSFKFCPECGQNREDDLTLSVLFYNTIANYFSFDARFFRSFGPLMTKPGFLPFKFVEGKRLKYIHPAQVYLFISVIFFFIFSFYTRDSRSSIDKAMKDDEIVFGNKSGKEKINEIIASDSIVVDSILTKVKENIDPEESAVVDSIFNEYKLAPKTSDTISKASNNEKQKWQTNFGFDGKKVDSLVSIGATDDQIFKEMGMENDAGFFKRKFYSQMLKFYKDRGLGAIWQTFFDSIPIAMFFLLPIFALLLKVFYYRKGRYAHHLVFSFYFFSFLFVVMAIVLGINRIWDMPDWIDTLIVLSTFFYFYIAVKKFYQQGSFISFLKSSVISFMFLGVVLLATIVLGLFAFMSY